MKLSDFVNKGQVPFINIKECQTLNFVYMPKIGIESFWIYRIPKIVEIKDDKTGQKKKIVKMARYISPGFGASYFLALRKWLEDNETSVPDEMVVYDLREELAGAQTKFNKHWVLGTDKVDDWKRKFSVQQEVYAGIVDVKDSAVKLLSMTGGTWGKWRKEMAYQKVRLGTLGDPDITPIVFAGTYNASEQNAQEKYSVRMEDRIPVTDLIKNQLMNGPTVDIKKVVARDHAEEVKRMVLQHTNPDILRQCADAFSVLDMSKREWAGYTGDSSFNTEKMDADKKASATPPVDESKVAFPYGSAPPAAAAAAAPVQAPVAGQIAAQAVAQAAAPTSPPPAAQAVSPTSSPPAAPAAVAKKPVMVPCLNPKCGKEFDLQGGVCPHCGTDMKI